MFNDYEDIAVLIDFDGTITDKDTNFELFGKKGALDLSIEELNDTEESEDINLLDKMRFIFEHIKITEEEYREFILNSFRLTPGFIEFSKELEKRNIPVAIVSGGFKNGIEIFLDKYGIDGMDIYAHELIFDGKDISIDFYGDPLDCCKNGPCGNCKILRYNEYKEKKDKIVFIGDGFTDRWVAREADVLFAKSDLIKFCEKDGVDCIEWDDFFDIKKMIFE